jgi:hypothetical protein
MIDQQSAKRRQIVNLTEQFLNLPQRIRRSKKPVRHHDPQTLEPVTPLLEPDSCLVERHFPRAFVRRPVQQSEGFFSEQIDTV